MLAKVALVNPIGRVRWKNERLAGRDTGRSPVVVDRRGAAPSAGAAAGGRPVLVRGFDPRRKRSATGVRRGRSLYCGGRVRVSGLLQQIRESRVVYFGENTL